MTQDAEVTLEVHICDQRRSYLATFSTPQQAVDFVRRKSENHAFFELPNRPIPEEGWEALVEELHPTCEHGLSLHLCHGPDHYPSDEFMRSYSYV